MSSNLPKSIVLAAFAASTLMVSVPASAADKPKRDPAKKLYMTKTCMACHGKNGRKAMLDYPNLAGQDEKYMVRQIEDIISGKRTGSPDATGNPRSEGMRGALVTAEGERRISKDEVKMISKWLAKQKPADLKPPKEPLDPASVEAGKKLYSKKCKACHGREGKKPLKGNPYVAGQKRAYIYTQMVDIRNKDRKGPKLAGMYGIVKKMSDDDFANLADYLSQVDRNAK